MGGIGGRSSNIFVATSPNGVGRSNTLNNKAYLNKALILAPEANSLSKFNQNTSNLSNSILKSGLLKSDANSYVYSGKVILIKY